MEVLAKNRVVSTRVNSRELDFNEEQKCTVSRKKVTVMLPNSVSRLGEAGSRNSGRLTPAGAVKTPSFPTAFNHASNNASSSRPGRAFIGRAAEVSAVTASLTLPRWHGAVVVGPGGIGKTALIQHVVGRIPRTTPTRYFRGTTLTQETPYGILGLLLGRAAGRSAPAPALADVLHAMSANLAADPSAGTPVVVVDNAEYADRWSALALSEMARTGAIRLILACRRINDIAAEFSHLWRRGIVARVDVPHLSYRDARALMCHEISGECSLAATAMTWEKSAGNPLHLKSLLRQAVEDGALVLSQGYWVWRDGRLRDAVPSGLGQVTRMLNAAHGNMALLELVAVARSIPVATLTRLFPVQDVDELLSSADLAYVGGGKSILGLAHPVLVNVLPLLVPKAQSRELFATVEAVDPLSQLQGAALENRMRWGVDCNAMAPGKGNAEEPLDFGAGPAAARESKVTQPAVSWHGLGTQERLTTADFVTAEQSLAVAQQTQRLAMEGRQDDALELVCSLTTRLGLTSSSPTTHRAMPLAPDLVALLLSTFTLSGEWKLQDALMAACQERGMSANVRDCAMVEVTHGLVQAFRGKYDDAVHLLSGGYAQVQDAGMHEWAAMAELAHLSALTLQGRSDLVGGYLGGSGPGATSHVDAGPNAVKTLKVVRDSSGIPALLCTLAQCLVAEATPPLQRSPILALNSAADSPAQRMLLLSVQVDTLNKDLCEQLLMVTATQGGALADVLGQYAKGVLAQDSSVLVETVSSACLMDYSGLSVKAARLALTVASPASARSIRRQLQRLVKLPEDHFDPANVLNSNLTERETTVGIMAANGLSNKDIALGMGVSVRTVEGHLYQIYAKLHVSSRSELIPFLKDSK